MERSSLFVDSLALGQDGLILAAVALLGRDEANAAVAVVVVVAAYELLHPEARLLEAGKSLRGIGRAVLAGAK